MLLAVCDSEYRFTYVNVGAPGRSNDAHIFKNCSLLNHVSNNDVWNNMAITLSNTKIPIHLIGDSAIPLMPNLMKPYPDTDQLSEEEKFFNYRLAVARRVIENAFGRLKGRFCILQQMDSRLENTSNIILCCAILHNFL